MVFKLLCKIQISYNKGLLSIRMTLWLHPISSLTILVFFSRGVHQLIY